MTTFTPGPWLAVEWNSDPVFNEDGNRFWGIKPEKFHYDVYYLEASGWMTEANARLIAAAPELFAAVLQYRDDLRHPPAPDSVERRLAMIEALLTKASTS